MTTVVQMPDGREIEFPDSMSPQQIETQVRRIGQPGRSRPNQPRSTSARRLFENTPTQQIAGAPQQLVPRPERLRPEQMIADLGSTLSNNDGTGFGAFGSTAAKRWLDNILNIPGGAGSLLAQGAAAVNTVPGTVSRLAQDQPLNMGERFRESEKQERGRLPASALLALQDKIPTARDLEAGGQAGREALSGLFQGESPNLGERFDDASEQLLEQDMQLREQHPLATGAGDVGGDVATLLTGRAPLARASRNRRLASKPPTPKPVSPGFKAQLDDIANSTVVRNLKRGGMRVGETGLEGAFIAALNEGDPLTNAALAGGSQAIGSTFMSLSEGILGNKGRNAAMALAAGTALIQMFKSATPGGRDRILESTETAANKLTAMVALGALASAAGMGRVGGRMADNLPAFADAITAVPRGAMVSLLSDIGQEEAAGENTMQVVMERMARDPDYFGPTAQRRILRAMNSEKLSVREEVNKLMKDRKFQRQFDKLMGEQ